MDFEWNADKARRNLAKHRVFFEEACEVFADPLSSSVQDPDCSIEEERFVIFGRSCSGQHMVVSFTDRGGRIRIISARRMIRREIAAYEQK
jgi:hypothetical protein